MCICTCNTYVFVEKIKLYIKLKRWEYQTTWSASWEICVQVKKQWLELDMEQENRFPIGKGVRQGCVMLPCLFNLYAKYIMRNAGLEEAEAGIKIAGRNINNLRYADDTTFFFFYFGESKLF